MTELQALLRRLVHILDEVGVPFMIAGSFASAAHGLPRTTQDVDVVIDPATAAALDALVAALPPDEGRAEPLSTGRSPGRTRPRSRP